MRQMESEQNYLEFRRRTRRRRRERQRQRRRRMLTRLGTTILSCYVLLMVSYGMFQAISESDAQERNATAQNVSQSETQTQTSNNSQPQEQGLSQETQTPQQPQEPEEPEKPEEPTVEVDPDSIIYLTFDDGPSGSSTEEILDILKENDVHATFFVVNYSADKVPLLQRMVDEGHTIGIHAYDHDYSTCYSTDDAYPDGITKLSEKLKNDVNYQPFCLRFPGGSSNTISRNYNEGVMTRLAVRVESMGLEYYDWNVDSGDAAGNHIDESVLVSNTKSELVKGRSNIVLMHDTDAKDTTVKALQAIIDYGKENGYHFEAIDPTTPPVHHHINN